MKRPKCKIKPMPIEHRKPYAPKKGIMSLCPASTWEDAFMSGNGNNGILAYGEPYREQLIYNNQYILEPQWDKPPKGPEIHGVLPKVRRLLLEGRAKEALDLSLQEAIDGGMSKAYKQVGNYHPAISIEVQIDGYEEASHYLRVLDYETGEARTTWSNDHGHWISRCFVSHHDDRSYYQLTPPEGVRCQGRILLKHNGLNLQYNLLEEEMDTIIEVIGPYTSYEDRNYRAYIRILGPTSAIKDAEGLQLIYNHREDVSITTTVVHDRHPNRMMAYKPSQRKGYHEALREHLPVYTKGYPAVQFHISQDEEERLYAIEELRKMQYMKDTIHKMYLQKAIDAGIYVLMSSSGALPIRFRSLWHGEPTNSPYVININYNLQVSFIGLGQLKPILESHFDYFDSQIEDWRQNAKRIMGTRGVLANCFSDGETGRMYHFGYNYPHHYWISGAGWIAHTYYEHYLMTRDQVFLRERVYPLLKEIALFYKDFLTLTHEDGTYLFIPSYSPENTPLGSDSPLAINSAMDIGVCREVLANLVETCRILGIDHEEVPDLEGLIQRLPTYQLNEEGALREWSYDGYSDQDWHRHLSHLYGCWPGHQIRRGSLWYDGARIAARKRHEQQGQGHGIMHRGLIAARLGDKELVERTLQKVLEEGYYNKSMMTNHNPYARYNADICCSLPTLYMESIIYSNADRVELFPALPDVAHTGAIEHFYTRAGMQVNSLSWCLRDGVVRMDFIAQDTCQVTLETCRGRIEAIRINDKHSTIHETYHRLMLDKDNRYVVTLYLE